MKTIFAHLRSYIFRGLLAVIPLLLCWSAVVLLYQLIDKRVMTFIDKFVDIRAIPGLGILLLLVALYLIGLIVSNFVGKQLFIFIGSVSERIPIIKFVYNIGKQFSESLSMAEGKRAFKKAVLIDCNGHGFLTVGFVVSTMKNADTGEEILNVFVPTAPTPATGLIFHVKPSQTIDPGWTVEEALKMVVTAGIISPEKFNNKRL